LNVYSLNIYGQPCATANLANAGRRYEPPLSISTYWSGPAGRSIAGSDSAAAAAAAAAATHVGDPG
jgi:hypothetical protein